MIAGGALFLSGGQNTLYGRYWGGCLDEYNHLHFETCYYQGIELALALGLTHFDAGAQGEHKLVRGGFEPVITHSWHGIQHPPDSGTPLSTSPGKKQSRYKGILQRRKPYCRLNNKHRNSLYTD